MHFEESFFRKHLNILSFSFIVWITFSKISNKRSSRKTFYNVIGRLCSEEQQRNVPDIWHKQKYINWYTLRVRKFNAKTSHNNCLFAVICCMKWDHEMFLWHQKFLNKIVSLSVFQSLFFGKFTEFPYLRILHNFPANSAILL